MPFDPARYEFRNETPAVDDYRRLRAVAGLSVKSEAAALRGLPNTLRAVVVFHEGRAVAMGRVVGDGGCHCQIVDMAVEPAHQGQGIGRRIVGDLVAWLHENAPDTAYVSLIADGEAHRLYAEFGFRPVAPASIGMALWVGGYPGRADG